MYNLDVRGLKRVLMALANWAIEARGNSDPELSQAMADVFFVQDFLGNDSSKEVVYETQTLQIWCDLLAGMLGLKPLETPKESMTAEEAAREALYLSSCLYDIILAAMGLLTPAEREEMARLWESK